MTSFSAAEKILRALGITEPGEIDLDAIAFCHGVEIRYRLLDGYEARIIGAGARAVVTINTRARPERQRFSVGHELGHWFNDRGRVAEAGFLCRKEVVGASRSFGTDPEAKANAFAAELLMPRYLFKPLAARCRIGIEAVDGLAKAFRTSLTATAIRFVQLGPTPAMVIGHSKTGRQWFTSGLDVPWTLLPGRELHHESKAFGLLYTGTRRSAATRMPADRWFEHRGAERFEVIEQSVLVRDDLVVSLVWWPNDLMLRAA